MVVMNDICLDYILRILHTAFEIATINKKQTLTARAIETSTRLVLNGDLVKHAISEGNVRFMAVSLVHPCEILIQLTSSPI